MKTWRLVSRSLVVEGVNQWRLLDGWCCINTSRVRPLRLLGRPIFSCSFGQYLYTSTFHILLQKMSCHRKVKHRPIFISSSVRFILIQVRSHGSRLHLSSSFTFPLHVITLKATIPHIYQINNSSPIYNHLLPFSSPSHSCFSASHPFLTMFLLCHTINIEKSKNLKRVFLLIRGQVPRPGEFLLQFYFL